MAQKNLYDMYFTCPECSARQEISRDELASILDNGWYDCYYCEERYDSVTLEFERKESESDKYAK